MGYYKEVTIQCDKCGKMVVEHAREEYVFGKKKTPYYRITQNDNTCYYCSLECLYTDISNRFKYGNFTQLEVTKNVIQSK